MQPLSLNTQCGRPPFRGAVTNDSTWHPHFSLSRSTRLHRVLVPVSLGSLPAGYTAPGQKGAWRSQEPRRPEATSTHL